MEDYKKAAVMDAQWVIGIASGKEAEAVLSHAHSGLGYFIRKQSGKGKNIDVEYAFKRAQDSPLPDHLALPDKYQIQKLDELYEKRH